MSVSSPSTRTGRPDARRRHSGSIRAGLPLSIGDGRHREGGRDRQTAGPHGLDRHVHPADRARAFHVHDAVPVHGIRRSRHREERLATRPSRGRRGRRSMVTGEDDAPPGRPKRTSPIGVSGVDPAEDGREARRLRNPQHVNDRRETLCERTFSAEHARDAGRTSCTSPTAQLEIETRQGHPGP